MISQARLKEVLHYDPETGVFTWRMDFGRGRKGQPAGTLRSDGYIRIQIEGYRAYASHFAWIYMTGGLPAGEVDHEDRNRANNAWSNLRPASKSQNCANRPARVDPSHGCRGVTRYQNRFKAQIRHLGTTTYLGLFDTPEAAHAAWAAAALKIHGEFAMLQAEAA